MYIHSVPKFAVPTENTVSARVQVCQPTRSVMDSTTTVMVLQPRAMEGDTVRSGRNVGHVHESRETSAAGPGGKSSLVSW